MEKTKRTRKSKGQNRSRYYYSISFKRRVAKEYLETGRSLTEIARQYGVSKVDVSNWKKCFSSELAEEPIIHPMTEQEKKDMKALQKQLDDLKKKLDYEQMRNFALETLVDLAKEEMGVDLRKNFGAKQPEE